MSGSHVVVIALVAAGVAIAVVIFWSLLRRRTASEHAAVPGSELSTADELLATRSLLMPAVAPDVVEILGPSGEMLARLSRSTTPQSKLGDPLPLPPALRASLIPFIGPTMQAMSVGVQAASAVGVVSLRFSPEVATMLASGAAHQMHSAATPGALRAIAQRADGRIVGNAEVLTGTNWALLATAAWQVAAIATAQKHLADINAKLADIAAGVEDLRQFLDDKEQSVLQSDIRYLRQRAEALARGDVEFAERFVVANQLDDIERRSGATFLLYQRQLERRVHDVKKMKDNTGSWWSTDASHGALEEAISKAAEQMTALVVAAHARTIAIRLRDALQLNQQTSVDLLAALHGDVEEAQRLWAEFQGGVRGVSKDLYATFEWESTTKQRRKDVTRALRANTKQTQAMLALIAENTRALPSPGLSDLEFSLTADAQGELVQARPVR